MKESCENCLHHKECKGANTACDNWEGDCEICVIQGEPIFNCSDCDWEEDEDEEDEE
jgi:hypothetical protein